MFSDYITALLPDVKIGVPVVLFVGYPKFVTTILLCASAGMHSIFACCQNSRPSQSECQLLDLATPLCVCLFSRNPSVTGTELSKCTECGWRATSVAMTTSLYDLLIGILWLQSFIVAELVYWETRLLMNVYMLMKTSCLGKDKYLEVPSTLCIYVITRLL